MKRYSLYIPMLALLAVSCAKVKVPKADLTVTTSSLTYKAGDTVTFQFAGNPDNITFYSGEVGRNYDYRTRTKADNSLQIDFKSFVSFSPIYQNLQLMVSNNFNGTVDAANVSAATWTDISQLATFSAGADNVASGVIDLRPYLGNAETPNVYVAFRYTEPARTTGQNRWVIRSFNADLVTPEGQLTNLAQMATGGWKSVDFKNPAAVWTITSAQLLMYGGAGNVAENEDWVISKPLVVSKSIQPDAGLALKNISKTMSSYQHVYKTPGTYKAVFVSSAIRYNGENSQTQELTFTITP
ncbi:DUF5017 domain-containing protein [Pseudoflavitalea sp. G-6-1-2]|uniref:DUF5017 domain-containing protein n=1 Tax=Pseudoflavitalea sp. G-6-1-2 TaxID=2728841 RepID=UPI00146B4828|nr:DUF5017 domain-containing protein [Pseudoflavitalea sp. G-6-1-2]NML21235.1 DUF5017 domain-containing protein [Pseudoflavitalea sp. G-6-1-2]